MATTKTRFVLVVWMDACSPATGGWVDAAEVDDLLVPQIFESVGMVVRENELLLVIASSVDHTAPIDNQMGGLIAIPKSCILNQSTLLMKVAKPTPQKL